MTMNEIAIEGRVIRPGEDGYDEQRLPWQRRFDPRPALIVEAAGPDDIQTAVRYAREADLPLAVQATGHGAVVPGDGALLLKTGALNSVDVDPRNASARVGAGAPWADVIAATPDGLAPLSGSATSVAVGGYTLGGGAGLLSRAYGFAADSLLSAEVITAEGERVTASPDEHPDLFWALRGGGGNFGVVTELEFRLHPAERLYGGMLVFGADNAHATLARYREWAPTEPDESNTAVLVMNMPPIPQVPEPVRGKRVLVVRALYLGDADAGAQALAPLLEAAGTPLMGAMQEMSYAETATLLGPAPPPSIAEARFALLDDVADEALDVLADPALGVTAVELRHWGGAMSSPPENAGPIGHRDVPFSVWVNAVVPERTHLAAAGTAADDIIRRLRPFSTGGSLLNFLSDPTETATAYTDGDYQRLTEIKAVYDPEDVFSAGHAIPPAPRSS
jgi:FAD/FMN-containing dehydrogenase